MEAQSSVGPIVRSAIHLKPKRKSILNATELARNKFNSLFAVHDAKDTRVAKQQQNPPLKLVKKAHKK
jgi:hypothetical protein